MSKLPPAVVAEHREIIRKFGRRLDPSKEMECYQEGTRPVTAIVDGKIVVESDQIRVTASYHEHGYAKVEFYWEDGGYKAFQKLGLPGTVSADFQSFQWEGPSLIIKGSWPDGRDYSIAVALE